MDGEGGMMALGLCNRFCANVQEIDLCPFEWLPADIT
jgi:hypothetical protein